jgi:hypothetical protein
MISGMEIEGLARRRVRLGLWIAVSFLVVLAAIAGSDALVRTHQVGSALHVAVLACLGLAGVSLVTSLWRFALLTRRSMRDVELKGRLWDELASANLTHSMVCAYLAMLAVLCVLAVISMFSTALSAPWVVNGMLITAFAVQSVSFAMLERRGDARS